MIANAITSGFTIVICLSSDERLMIMKEKIRNYIRQGFSDPLNVGLAIYTLYAAVGCVLAFLLCRIEFIIAAM